MRSPRVLFGGSLAALRGSLGGLLGRDGNVLRSSLAAKACGLLRVGVWRQRDQILSAKGVMLVPRQVPSIHSCQRPELWQVLPYRNCLLNMDLRPIMAGWGPV